MAFTREFTWAIRQIPGMIRGLMNRSGKLHALLSTARVANIPSVVSNVWLGVFLTWTLDLPNKDPDGVVIPWLMAGSLSLAGICLYIAGNFLNDWMDREWDVKNRPERALPRGLFPPNVYLAAAASLTIAGIAVAVRVNWLAGLMATMIVACIVIYTIWHKRAPWTVVPMGLCRGFLPMMGALGSLEIPDRLGDSVFIAIHSGILGSALFCHIVGLSLSARNESQNRPSNNIGSIFVIAAALMGLPFLFTGEYFLIGLAGVAPYGLWIWRCQTVSRKPIPRYVSALLAGIPLLDWVFLMPASWLIFQAGDAPLALTLAGLALPPLAFISALRLQRLAPAT